MRKIRYLAAAAAAITVATLALQTTLCWSEVSGPGLLVLTYHQVIPDSGRASRYKIPVTTFARQLDFLRESGYTFVGPEDLGGAGAAAGVRRVSVPGTISLAGFGRLLTGSGMMRVRVAQRCRSAVHALIGSTRYVALTEWARRAWTL